MEDLFKKFLYTSVGLVTMTAEKIQETVDKLVDEEKLSSEEGKKVVDEFLANTETKTKEFEEKLKSITEEVMSKFNFNKSKSFSDLEARVTALEGKVGVEAATPAAPAKKAPAKKAAAKA